MPGSAAEAQHASEAGHAPHWGYSGAQGPEHWGNLSQDFAACDTGHEQSPIDLAGEVTKDLPDIAFHYQPSALNILNNGHTIQVNYDPGSTIEVDGITYELKQFHFHTHSEHTLHGTSYPLEMHLVHQSVEGQLAVVGVMAEAGADNGPLTAVWANMPTTATETAHVDAQINAADLLPADHTYYGYAGSLTTPPCSEGVKWHVLTTPMQLSTTQLDTMAALLHDNFRPVQPLYDRELDLDIVGVATR
ncbi:MAG: carbonic anhydrase family protein [Caldilineaceae bacterium]|nr:carbonic anhydrase family protein [Caldilineaceae bacterium]